MGRDTKIVYLKMIHELIIPHTIIHDYQIWSKTNFSYEIHGSMCNPVTPLYIEQNYTFYNSDFPVAFSMNLLKMLVLVVNSSNFSGAKPPFLIIPSNLASSLAT
ncbi:hypothetical protein EYC80_008852 [Monilinia laxa]|uniref:Uncharacterized protein n=1 Tax=Monilinia laxa TaxID=61186 RepID=A0A5N6K1Z6_MONLA|nr:hypothetical protein EYC80_008852 [Monilinia laxa]